MDVFSPMLFANFNYVFKDLPLIATYHCNQGSFMCLHGGIPILVDDNTGEHPLSGSLLNSSGIFEVRILDFRR